LSQINRARMRLRSLAAMGRNIETGRIASSPLGRRIAAILAIKLAALYALWALFFASPPPHGPGDVARALLSQPQPAAAREVRK